MVLICDIDIRELVMRDVVEARGCPIPSHNWVKLLFSLVPRGELTRINPGITWNDVQSYDAAPCTLWLQLRRI